MPTFYLLIGLPGSGKSTYIENFEEDAVVVSSDAIREELYGSAEVQDNPARVFQIAHERVIAALQEGQNAILDATNLNAKKRANLLAKIDKQVKDPVNKVAIVIATSIKACVERQVNRERKVPEEVIWRMARQFQTPSDWEGWTEIRLVRTEVSYYDKLEHDLSYSNVPHYCKYHMETIRDHMLFAEALAAYKAKTWGYPTEEIEFIKKIARYHDIGKIYTVEFVTKGETKVAHYYGHENVSAYLFLCDPILQKTLATKEILVGSYVINCHMRHYSEKNMDKFYSEKMGKYAEYLRILEEADSAASFPDEKFES